MVRGDSDLHNTLEIFLVDRGVTKTLDEGNLRLLDPQHSLLPFQAEEVELSQLEAPDREGGWRPEAAQTLLEIIETADYLSAVVESVAGLPSGKIVLKVSAVKGEDTEDVAWESSFLLLGSILARCEICSQLSRLYYTMRGSV